MLILLGAAATAVLMVLRVGRPLWSMIGAALMLAGAGYAVQGRPALPASPAAPAPGAAADESELIELRGQMMGRFTADDIYLLAADALARAGDRHAAAQVLLGGLRAMPRSLEIWTAFGTALAAQDGAVSPPALFAFQQGARLSPTHPGPPFFLGMAEIRGGDFVAARRDWARALAFSPPGVAYRAGIAERLALLDRYLATAPR